tara:strand:+ start:935 stop:1333 length:399 start_codon:yes stop_codon:yes gene_type:complete
MLKYFLLFLSITLCNSNLIYTSNYLKTKIKKDINIKAIDCEIINNFLSPEIKQESSKAIIKTMSDTLPQFDSISHIVLNTNSRLIEHVLYNDMIPEAIKKYIILFAIKMTQEGDNMGGHILELYYHIVDKLL